MYKYNPSHPYLSPHLPSTCLVDFPTNTSTLLLSHPSSITDMSRPSSPIFVSSRDSTPTPEPISNLALAQMQAQTEASRTFHQERVVNLGDDETTAIRHAAAHGAIIGHWASLFNTPISEVLHAFSNTPSAAIPHMMQVGPPSPTLQYPDANSTASTPPIPIPPFTQGPTNEELTAFNEALTVMANNEGLGPTTLPDPVPPMPTSPPPFLPDGPIDASPSYARDEEVDEVMNALVLRDVEAAAAALAREEEERRRTPSPTGPQPGVHPGPGWSVNFEDPGFRYVFNIPSDGEQRELATFVQIDWNATNPELLGTLGRSCPIYARSLHARPDEFPRPAFDLQQEFFFADKQTHTAGVDWAMEQENDNSLRAEVIRHRAAKALVVRRARQLADLREQLADDRFTLGQSTRRLAKANAYHRLRRHITHTLAPSTSPLNSRHINRIKEAVESPWNWTDEKLSDRCAWCEKEGHRVESCALLRVCQLCWGRGHLEEKCFQPHQGCTRSLPCRVPLSHQHFDRHACPSIITLERN